MPKLIPRATPHLLGRIAYTADSSLRPDGDTVHLFDPVLVVNGEAIKPENGRLRVWVTGEAEPKVIKLKGLTKRPYVPIRFEGLDAPEEHYRATPFELETANGKQSFPIDPAVPHEERAQPLWKPATDYVLSTLGKAGWACIRLDREVTDKYGRVLGYVYASDPRGTYGTFVSLELVKRGLAFPFLFESSGSLIPKFLAAAKRAYDARLGVWRNYSPDPVGYEQSFLAPRSPHEAEPAEAAAMPLNLPVVFRRVVDAKQLEGLSLVTALRKYDAMDYETGEVLPGEQYGQIPIERLIWAPHKFV